MDSVPAIANALRQSSPSTLSLGRTRGPCGDFRADGATHRERNITPSDVTQGASGDSIFANAAGELANPSACEDSRVNNAIIEMNANAAAPDPSSDEARAIVEMTRGGLPPTTGEGLSDLPREIKPGGIFHSRDTG